MPGPTDIAKRWPRAGRPLGHRLFPEQRWGSASCSSVVNRVWKFLGSTQTGPCPAVSVENDGLLGESYQPKGVGIYAEAAVGWAWTLPASASASGARLQLTLDWMKKVREPAAAVKSSDSGARWCLFKPQLWNLLVIGFGTSGHLSVSQLPHL